MPVNTTLKNKGRFPSIQDPQLVPVDYDADLLRLKEDYHHRTGYYPTINDPETAILEQVAYEENELKALINYESKQNLLPFAENERLDNLGLLTETERLKASPSQTIIQFAFITTHTSFVILKGYQMMAVDGVTLFVATVDTVIDSADTSKDITFECTDVGTAANGFAAGQIEQMVKPLPDIESASNIVISQGGSDIESDDAFAYRIYLAPSKFSVAGPYDAYEYFALSANPAIKNVSIWNPSPNCINISALLFDGSIPNQVIKEQILAQCSGEKRVPMGDLVSIVDVATIEFTATYRLQIFNDYSALADKITKTAQRAIQSTLDNWKTQHGRDIVPLALSSIAQGMEGVYLVMSEIKDDRGKVITDKLALDKQQRPDITITTFDFTVVSEQSNQTNL